MTVRWAIFGMGLAVMPLTGCVAGAGYETYSGPIYLEPEPVVVDEVIVEPRYRRYDDRRYYRRGHGPRYDHYRHDRGRHDYYRRPRG